MRHLIWLFLGAVIAAPVVLAATSPLLEWREPVDILAGFAGIVAFALMVMQPLLAAGLLPGVALGQGRRVHRLLGSAIVLGVILHVGALWITSPPDVIDALLLVSPTPFSDYGVMAMWALIGAAVLAVFRRRLKLSLWRLGHTALVTIAVLGTVLHTLYVDGTMEVISKIVLCVVLLAALAWAVMRLRAWAMLRRVSR